MQKPRIGPPPSKAELDAARLASIAAFAAADKAQRAYLSLIERARFDVESKTQFLFRETMQEKPRSGS